MMKVEAVDLALRALRMTIPVPIARPIEPAPVQFLHSTGGPSCKEGLIISRALS